jgi:hypothetical protein
MANENRLPDKLSDLIELAVADCRKVEADPRYELNMNAWHSGLDDRHSRCAVCMAGAVMAQTLGVPYEHTSIPEFCGIGTSMVVEDRLYALDAVRLGNVATALAYLDEPADDVAELAGALIAEKFDVNAGRAPWDAYLAAARVLRSADL